MSRSLIVRKYAVGLIDLSTRRHFHVVRSHLSIQEAVGYCRGAQRGRKSFPKRLPTLRYVELGKGGSM
jgi:hypothetical protein